MAIVNPLNSDSNLGGYCIATFQSNMASVGFAPTKPLRWRIYSPLSLLLLDSTKQYININLANLFN